MGKHAAGPRHQKKGGSNKMKVIKFLDRRLEEVILVLLLSCIVVIMLCQIVCRYVLNDSLSWSEEFCRYCYIGTADTFCFDGAGVPFGHAFSQRQAYSKAPFAPRTSLIGTPEAVKHFGQILFFYFLLACVFGLYNNALFGFFKRKI